MIELKNNAVERFLVLCERTLMSFEQYQPSFLTLFPSQPFVQKNIGKGYRDEEEHCIHLPSPKSVGEFFSKTGEYESCVPSSYAIAREFKFRSSQEQSSVCSPQKLRSVRDGSLGVLGTQLIAENMLST